MDVRELQHVSEPRSSAGERHFVAIFEWHLRHVYAKHGLSRQAELMRLVVSLAEIRWRYAEAAGAPRGRIHKDLAQISCQAPLAGGRQAMRDLLSIMPGARVRPLLSELGLDPERCE